MIKYLWTYFWKQYIFPGEKVIKVYGLRTALISDKCGSVRRITACPIATWYEKKRRRKQKLKGKL